MPSVLGSAVFQMTASTVGLGVGLNKAFSMVSKSLKDTGIAMQKSAALTGNVWQANLGSLIELFGGAVYGAGLLTQALVGLSVPARIAAMHLQAVSNIGLTFGSLGSTVSASIDRISQAFGQSRIELAGYADEVGRELTAAGVPMDQAAMLAEKVAKATAQLAAARGISPQEAFGQVKSHAMLFDQSQIRGFAKQHNIIVQDNEVLTRNNELMIQYALAAEEVAAYTGDISSATATWQNSLSMMLNSFREVAIAVGTEVAPAFMMLFDIIKAMVDGIRDMYGGFKAFMNVVFGGVSLNDAFAAWKNPVEGPTAGDATDAANAARIEENRKRQLLGQAQQFRGFHGGAAAFHEQIQTLAWQANLLRENQRQTAQTALVVGNTAQTNKTIALLARNQDNATF